MSREAQVSMPNGVTTISPQSGSSRRTCCAVTRLVVAMASALLKLRRSHQPSVQRFVREVIDIATPDGHEPRVKSRRRRRGAIAAGVVHVRKDPLRPVDAGNRLHQIAVDAAKRGTTASKIDKRTMCVWLRYWSCEAATRSPNNLQPTPTAVGAREESRGAPDILAFAPRIGIAHGWYAELSARSRRPRRDLCTRRRDWPIRRRFGTFWERTIACCRCVTLIYGDAVV